MHSLRNTALGNCLDLNRILIGKRIEEMASIRNVCLGNLAGNWEPVYKVANITKRFFTIRPPMVCTYICLASEPQRIKSNKQVQGQLN